MLRTVFIRHQLSIAQIFLKYGVHHNLFADGVTSEFPDELILIAGLLVRVIGTSDAVVVVLQLAMVMGDSVADFSHDECLVAIRTYCSRWVIGLMLGTYNPGVVDYSVLYLSDSPLQINR